MLEGDRAVDEDDGDVAAVAALQLGVGLDVDLLEGEAVLAAGPADFGLRLVAEVAAGFRVKNYARLVRHRPPPRLSPPPERFGRGTAT